MTTAQILEMNRPMKEKLFNFPGEIRAKKAELERRGAFLKKRKPRCRSLKRKWLLPLPLRLIEYRKALYRTPAGALIKQAEQIMLLLWRRAAGGRRCERSPI